jgi:hypothetical protein
MTRSGKVPFTIARPHTIEATPEPLRFAGSTPRRYQTNPRASEQERSLGKGAELWFFTEQGDKATAPALDAGLAADRLLLNLITIRLAYNCCVVLVDHDPPRATEIRNPYVLQSDLVFGSDGFATGEEGEVPQ